MKRVALALITLFLVTSVVVPTEASAATRKSRSYKKGKKIRRSKAASHRARQRAKRASKHRSVIN